MTYEYQGKCHCGNATFTVILPRSLDNYAPRACDCDFCTILGLTYLSDPEGSLELISSAPFRRTTQGSGQAQFLSCTNCEVIVSVIYPSETGLKGTVNAALINKREQLHAPVAVSPKLLEPAEKIKRWDKLWFPVSLHEGS